MNEVVVTLAVERACWLNGKPRAPGDKVRVSALVASDAIASGRCSLAAAEDRKAVNDAVLAEVARQGHAARLARRLYAA